MPMRCFPLEATILTLDDDDVAATLDRLHRNLCIALEQLINEALRRGPKEMGRRRQPCERVRTKAVALGRLPRRNVQQKDH